MFFINYLIHYMPLVATGCLLYVSYVIIEGQLWWFTPTNALALFSDLLPEKIVPVEEVFSILPSSTLDKSIRIGSIYGFEDLSHFSHVLKKQFGYSHKNLAKI
ncbi:hypothetical protein D3C87_356360 [compost metagenome]